MADKYLDVVSGVTTQREATVVSTGVAEAGDVVALDAAGKLDNSVMPTGIGADVKVAVASENLTAGDWVNIFDDTGTEKVRKADATDATKPCTGFVKDNVTAPASATVYLEGVNDDLSGLTAGQRQYLSTTPGAESTTAPSASGNIVQFIGQAISATEVSFEAGDPITLA